MKKISTHQQSARGQTLVEVIVVVGVVILLVTGLVVSTVTSLRTSQSSRDRSLATKYAQEGIELSRKLRDNSWSTFLAYGDPGPKIWCLPKDGIWPASPVASAGACEGNVDTIYNRNITFMWNATQNRMEITVTVSWNDGNSTHQNELFTYFTQWQ